MEGDVIWVLSAVGALLASELFLRLPILKHLGTVGTVSRKSMKALGAKGVSDHWKEKVLPAYSLRLAKAAISFFFFLALALLPVVLVGFAWPAGLTDWLGAIMAPLVLVFLMVVSLGYIYIRTKVLGRV